MMGIQYILSEIHIMHELPRIALVDDISSKLIHCSIQLLRAGTNFYRSRVL
jgi:hypothetical protein